MIRNEMYILTWSSKGSSQKQGIYLAHSTSISSCCFIESQTSSVLAILFCDRSLHDIAAGELI